MYCMSMVDMNEDVVHSSFEYRRLLCVLLGRRRARRQNKPQGGKCSNGPYLIIHLELTSTFSQPPFPLLFSVQRHFVHPCYGFHLSLALEEGAVRGSKAAPQVKTAFLLKIILPLRLPHAFLFLAVHTPSFVHAGVTPFTNFIVSNH